MSLLVNETRRFWAHGLNAVAGKQVSGLQGWIEQKDYALYSGVMPDEFSLTIVHSKTLLAGLAADVSRLGAAAMESVHEVDQSAHSPKAAAWVLIRLYYAAFFAAHTVLRAYGTSVVQLESQQTTAVEEVAAAWAALGGSTVSIGQYVCTLDGAGATLRCRHSRSGTGGAHEVLWRTLRGVVRDLSSQTLKAAGASLAAQSVATKLADFETNLCLNGRNGGNWLSYVRNQVTYRQEYGCWYPYAGGETRATLVRMAANCYTDPMALPLVTIRARPIECFVMTIAFLVGWCRATIDDMAARCPRGRSFLWYGPKGYLAQVEI